MATAEGKEMESKLSYVQLSPRKGKHWRSSREVPGSKQNKGLNFETINVPIRTERPFEKIPTFDEREIRIRQGVRVKPQGEKSKKQKLTVTKLIYDGERMGNRATATWAQKEEAIGQEEFNV